MKDKIQALSSRIQSTLEMIQTEEATKNAYIMPFLQILGYDVFNPLEIVPEYTADIGIKKGEKVDYAIMLNGQPEILIECKDCRNELNVDNESQLFRYFHTTKAKFGVLTNGITWKFFTDLSEPNKMDRYPFLEINLLNPDVINYKELEKFSKDNFNADNIRKTADMLKCSSSIKTILLEEFKEPSEELLRLVFKKMDTSASVFNDKQREKIRPLVKNAIEMIIKDKVQANLESALQSTNEAQEAANVIHEMPEESDKETTQEEIDAYNIIKAIGSEYVTPDMITMRDAKSYCAILFDDNNRKTICRLYFNNLDKKSIGIFTDSEEKISIQNVNDLFTYKGKIIQAIKKFL